jgi:ubiquinone/menaquinone biosynthesis C-methylase UbiE
MTNDIRQLPYAWSRYDDVAEAYDRFQEKNGHSSLAKDLTIALNMAHGASLLDVGCGSGAATVAACEAVGAGGFVVGVDPSLAMLGRAAVRGARHLVVGITPGLPFRDRSFDGVTANLVLSHVEAFDTALRDMVRVLKRGGRLGVSAGAKNPNRPNVAYQRWEDTAESFVGREALREAAKHAVPWEPWLTDAANVESALRAVGLDGVEIQQREYPVTMPIEEYLAMLDLFAYGRFLRYRLGPIQWEAFRKAVGEKVADGMKQINYTGRYHIAVGTRR